MGKPKYLTIDGVTKTYTEWSCLFNNRNYVCVSVKKHGEEYAIDKIRERLYRKKKPDKPMDCMSVRDVANAAFKAGMTYGEYVKKTGI